MTPYPLVFALFQERHYKWRIAEARTLEERYWLKAEYQKVKANLIAIYN